MAGGVNEARARRNALERLAARIPGIRGYLERETRREVDKLERDWIAGRIDGAREALQGAIREWSRTGNLANLDRAASLEKNLDRFANRVRHADYGYTGFFDAVKIGTAELDRIYELDLSLVERVEELADRIATLPATASEAAIAGVAEALAEADRLFDTRATVFENVTKGEQP